MKLFHSLSYLWPARKQEIDPLLDTHGDSLLVSDILLNKHGREDVEPFDPSQDPLEVCVSSLNLMLVGSDNFNGWGLA